MTSPHPETLFHLEPLNPFSEQVLHDPQNRQFVSQTRNGKRGLEVGYHVPSLPGGHVITRLGRKADLTLARGTPDNPISRVHVSFEINPATHFVVLSVRSKRVTSVTIENTQTENPQTESPQIENPQAIEQQKERLQTSGDGVLLVNQPYTIGIASYSFLVVWRQEAREGETQDLLVRDYRESLRLVESVDSMDRPTDIPESEVLTWHNTRLATANSGAIRELANTPREQLGEGAFGVVYSTTDSVSGHKFAVKKIRLEGSSLDAQRALIHREVSIMRQMNHPHIIQLLGQQHFDTMAPEIFMPLCDGPVTALIMKCRESEIPLLCQEVFKQMLLALDYLECERLLHRDIKPDNILFSSVPGNSQEIKHRFQLSDFGLANYRRIATTHCGTLCYEAPELHPYESNVHADQTSKMDVWSLFATLVACLSKFKKFPPPSNQYTEYLRVLRQSLREHSVFEPMARLEPARRVAASRMYLMYFGTEGLTTKPNQIPPLPDASGENDLILGHRTAATAPAPAMAAGIKKPNASPLVQFPRAPRHLRLRRRENVQHFQPGQPARPLVVGADPLRPQNVGVAKRRKADPVLADAHARRLGAGVQAALDRDQKAAALPKKQAPARQAADADLKRAHGLKKRTQDAPEKKMGAQNRSNHREASFTPRIPGAFVE